jgi:hypothetical protein
MRPGKFNDGFDATTMISIIEEGIAIEKINLQVNEVLNNNTECIRIKHRIADAKIVLLLLRGDFTPS